VLMWGPSNQVIDHVAASGHLADLRDHTLVVRVRLVSGQGSSVHKGGHQDDVGIGLEAFGFDADFELVHAGDEVFAGVKQGFDLGRVFSALEVEHDDVSQHGVFASVKTWMS